LTNHNKTKHFQNDPNFIRGRGRPRKNPLLPMEKDSFHQINFFARETRKRREGEEFAYHPLTSVYEVFNSMYNNYKEKIFHKNPEMENHNLLKTYKKQLEALNTNTNTNTNNQNLNPDEINTNPNPEEINYNVIDEIFSKYLVETNKDSNKEYYEFIVKFVILFRECINKIKAVEGDEEEYSVKNNADTVPDSCNEFITDFMEGFDYFGLDTMELIEIIQHFCNWLYDNKFTTSKLSLVS